MDRIQLSLKDDTESDDNIPEFKIWTPSMMARAVMVGLTALTMAYFCEYFSRYEYIINLQPDKSAIVYDNQRRSLGLVTQSNDTIRFYERSGIYYTKNRLAELEKAKLESTIRSTIDSLDNLLKGELK